MIICTFAKEFIQKIDIISNGYAWRNDDANIKRMGSSLGEIGEISSCFRPTNYKNTL